MCSSPTMAQNDAHMATDVTRWTTEAEVRNTYFLSSSFCCAKPRSRYPIQTYFALFVRYREKVQNLIYNCCLRYLKML